jgi:hypothetical protein
MSAGSGGAKYAQFHKKQQDDDARDDSELACEEHKHCGPRVHCPQCKQTLIRLQNGI